jgi:hypothetical protein
MSIINFDLRQIARATMDCMLPRGSGEDRGLLIKFKARASLHLDYADLTDLCRNKCDNSEEGDGIYEAITEGFTTLRVNLLLVRPMNYTRTLMQIGSDDQARNLHSGNGQYLEKTYHDSCWDSNFGELDSLLRTQAQQLVERMKPNLRPEFQSLARVTYDSQLDEIALKKIEAVRIGEEGSRDWTIKLSGDVFGF